MINKLGKAVAVASLLGAAHAQAVSFDGDVTMGRRWTQFENKKDSDVKFGVQAQDFSMAGHVQPSSDAPVSVGLRANLVNLKNKDITNAFAVSKTETAYGWEVAPEVKVWMPSDMLGTELVSPYLKLSYTMDALSAYTTEVKAETGAKAKLKGKASGLQVNLGADVTVTENLGVLVEYSYTQKELQNKLDGEKLDKMKYNSNAFLLGARVSV